MAAALKIQNLRKRYDSGLEALKGINLEVSEGDFFALLGPNGAGKSTTLGVICSLVNKTSGSVEVFGHDIDVDFCAAKKEIGVVPQEFNFNNFEKVFDIVVNQGGYYGLPRALARQRAEKYLTKLGLWDKRAAPARELSGGMKRRLMIARALVHEPRLLILDEPTAGVDIELRRSMWEFLREINQQNGTTIILTTHYLEEAESLCRNIAIIDHGQMVQNTSMKELLSQLHKEVFVLDCITAVPSNVEISGFDIKILDDGHCLEVVVDKGQTINTLFESLNEQHVVISSMRNKANRLEELFVSLLNDSQAGQ